ncbi:hypothetical protein NQD34_005939 [Periophthalmus magnuspinnatus]|nr:hypothetical protein NQD34_005939 [Periophthalmus magnuspinnatus]
MRNDASALLVSGCVFFPGVLFLSKRLIKYFLVCSESDAIIAATRFVSSLQSALATSAGLLIVSSCSDLVYDRHWLAESYVLFAVPYFLYDIIAMFLCYCHKLRVKGQGAESVTQRSALIGFLRKEMLLVLHHLFMVTFCFPASVFWRGGKGDYFQGLLLLPEFSTPFLCLSKVLIQFNRQNSLLYKINGLLTLGSFFCCRVLLFPYLYYSYSRFAGVPLLSVLSSAPWQCNLGAGLLWPLQLHWFRLLCRAAVRSLTCGERHTHTGSTGQTGANGTKSHSD